MRPKVGINGFGRVGRMILRAALQKNLDVVAINDIAPVEQMLYAFKFDTTHGGFDGKLEIQGEDLVVDDIVITTFNRDTPRLINWNSVGARYIIEATGAFTQQDQASGHFEQGATKVVITAISKDVKVLCMSVNHNTYDPKKDKVVCAGSATLQCLAPLAKVVHDKYTIMEGMLMSCHSVASTQRVVDGLAGTRNMREGRSVLGNIIPWTMTAAKDIGRVIPDLEGKMEGTMLRVPIKTVSTMELVCNLENGVEFGNLCKTLEDASRGKMLGILGYSQERVEHSDFVSNTISCNFDAKSSSRLDKNWVRLVAWYDNEVAYAHRIVDIILHMAEVDEHVKVSHNTA